LYIEKYTKIDSSNKGEEDLRGYISWLMEGDKEAYIKGCEELFWFRVKASND
jgi:hypothetical protein